MVVLSADGAISTAKSATTPDDFSSGVMDALEQAAAAMDLGVDALLGQCDLVKHGSTVATNALITRRGVRVGLITTRGFEDTPLIMRAVGRVDGLPADEVRHIADVTKPEPLVRPELIRGVRERVDADGRVVVPLNLDDARRAATELIHDHQVQALGDQLPARLAQPDPRARHARAGGGPQRLGRGQRRGRPLPVNVTGAIAAGASDMGFRWEITRAFALIGRTLGALAHIQEEMDQPISDQLIERIRHDIDYRAGPPAP